MAKLKTGRHTSSIKAVRQAEKRALRNRILKKKTRTEAKALSAAAAANDKEKAGKLLLSASAALDKAKKKGAIHWKTAARRKSRLAAKVNKIAA